MQAGVSARPRPLKPIELCHLAQLGVDVALHEGTHLVGVRARVRARARARARARVRVSVLLRPSVARSVVSSGGASTAPPVLPAAVLPAAPLPAVPASRACRSTRRSAGLSHRAWLGLGVGVGAGVKVTCAQTARVVASASIDSSGLVQSTTSPPSHSEASYLVRVRVGARVRVRVRVSG